MAKTPVEVLLDHIPTRIKEEKYKIIEEILELEKEHIINAAIYEPFLGRLPKDEGIFYYNKVYKENGI